MFYLIYIYQENKSQNTAENLASFDIINEPERILPYALEKKPETEVVPFDDFSKRKSMLTNPYPRTINLTFYANGIFFRIAGTIGNPLNTLYSD